MADKQLNEEIEMRVNALEDMQMAVLTERAEYLNKELEIRNKLSFKKVEPTFEYESDPEYLEHLKWGLKISVDDQLLNIQQAMDTITNNRAERVAIKKLREEN